MGRKATKHQTTPSAATARRRRASRQPAASAAAPSHAHASSAAAPAPVIPAHGGLMPERPQPDQRVLEEEPGRGRHDLPVGHLPKFGQCSCCDAAPRSDRSSRYSSSARPKVAYSRHARRVRSRSGKRKKSSSTTSAGRHTATLVAEHRGQGRQPGAGESRRRRRAGVLARVRYSSSETADSPLMTWMFRQLSQAVV